jgi:hypothetical protein
LSAGRSAIWSEGGQLVTAVAGTEEALVIAVKENGGWKGRVVPVAAAAATGQVAY